MSKSIFVTVGSTQFDGLIKLVDSKEFHDLAREKGFSKVTAQYGAFSGKLENLKDSFAYAKPDNFKKRFEEADLVIGHAGAGTIMEVLQLGKPLIVVVNGDLMENHQTEVANEFYQRGLLQMSTLDTFLDVFKRSKLDSNKITYSADGIFKELEEHFNFHQ